MPPGAATSGLRLGPFFESAIDENSGASVFAIRPFYSYEEKIPPSLSTNSPSSHPNYRSEQNFLWPLAVSSQRGNHSYWRALLFYGTNVNDDPSSPNDPFRFRFFPFFFSGRTNDGKDYAALFPFYGSVHNFLLFNELHFAFFPLYAEGKTANVEMKTVLWPFYLTRHGENIDQLRIWPFYGKTTTRRKSFTQQNRFVLWPFWSSTHSAGQVSGSGFLFFPFYGHSLFERTHRGTEERWSVLPPLFTYARGDDGFRLLTAPWPFIRQLDYDDHHERHYWPIYGFSETKSLSRSYLFWPLFSISESSASGYRDRFLQAPLPLYFHKSRSLLSPTSANSQPLASYSRLWPLFSHRYTESGETLFRFPELSLWSNSEQIERNWAPLWSLYTYRKKNDGSHCNDLLWGFLSWGRNGNGNPIFSFLWIPFAR